VNHVSRCVQKAVRMKEQKWSFSSHVSIRTRALKTRLFWKLPQILSQLITYNLIPRCL
jgi:hypothetical protein